MQRVSQELGAEVYAQGRFDEAIRLFRDLSLSMDFEEFLTLPALPLLRAHEVEESTA